jgi:hypothetical protein
MTKHHNGEHQHLHIKIQDAKIFFEEKGSLCHQLIFTPQELGPGVARFKKRS